MCGIPSVSRKMDSFSLCCYASLHLEKVSCEYPKLEGNALSSCNRMIDASGPRRSIWLLGILAVVGNLAVIAWRLIRRDDHPVQTCLLTNLAVADFLMGVYLMIIAIKDQIWAGIYISCTYYAVFLSTDDREVDKWTSQVSCNWKKTPKNILKIFSNSYRLCFRITSYVLKVVHFCKCLTMVAIKLYSVGFTFKLRLKDVEDACKFIKFWK